MSRTILLADDSVTIQKVIELTFMEEDYEVVAAGDGDEALERLDELRPDFVIADVHMPGASGIDVCRRSKQLHPDVPVLLLVGTFEPFDEDEARAAGADAHLKKPFDSQELLQLVDDLMGPAEAAAPAASAPVAGVPEEGDSTWGFDVAGETGEPSAEPEWAVPAEEPEPEWAASPSPPATEPEPEWAASPSPPATEPEPEWAASPSPPATEPEPEWAAEPFAAAGRGEPEVPIGGEGEWGPLDRQPAEVTPPAVGQVEVEEPAWGRPYPGDAEPAAAREPFELGEVEPRQRGHEEVFDLGAGEEGSAGAGAEAGVVPEAEVVEKPAEPARAAGAVSYGADPGWGFAVVEGEAKGGPAPGAAGAPAPEEGGDAGPGIAAAGFRWDEPEEPGSLVLPPDEPYPAVAGEPSWGEPSWSEPEEAEPEAIEPAAEPEPAASAAAPPWGEPEAASEPSWEPGPPAAEPLAAEPEAAEPFAAAATVPGSDASYGDSEVGAPSAAEPPAPAAPAGGLSEGDVERIARRVAELVGERVTREVAWEVVPDLAEVVIRERLRELEGQID